MGIKMPNLYAGDNLGPSADRKVRRLAEASNGRVSARHDAKRKRIINRRKMRTWERGVTRFCIIGVFTTVVGLAAYGGIASGLERGNANNVAFGAMMIISLYEFAVSLR